MAAEKKAKRPQSLQSICNEVISIEEKLMYGQISFQYDNLMCAMKPGHPMEILDNILARIFFTVMDGKTPSMEDLTATLEEFKAFKDVFGVKQMSKPIDHLEAWIKYHENDADNVNE